MGRSRVARPDCAGPRVPTARRTGAMPVMNQQYSEDFHHGSR
jgi:hypothetical protein